MTIKELLVLFKFNVDSPSFNNAQALLSQLEQKAQALEDNRNPIGKGKFDDFNYGANSAIVGVNALMGRLRMLAGMAGITLTVNGLIQTADQWRTIEGQIKNVVGEGENLEEVQNNLYQIAGRTRQSYAQTAGLFTSVSRSAGDLGKSTEEILAFTEDVAMAMRAGGGTAESQAAALVQLGQALGSGALRGDELNSILEQAPVLANTIAQGMGASIGKLRSLGREGKITSAIIFEAVRSQHDALVRQIGNSPLTMPAAFMRVRDAVGRVVYKLNQGYDIVGKMAKTVAGFADSIDEINLDYLISGLKIVAFWVFLITSYLKFSAISQGLITIGGHLLFIVKILKQLLGFQVVWGSLEAAIGAGVIVFALKWLLIITAIFVVLEDIYQLFTGGESVLGDWLGGMTIAERWGQWVTEFKASMKQLGEFTDWIFNHFDSSWDGFMEGAELAGKIAFEMLMLPVTAIANLGKALGWAFEGIAKLFGLEGTKGFEMYFKNPNAVDPASLVSDGGATTNNRSMTNSNNTTNNITVTAPNGSAEAIASAVSDAIPGSPSYDFAME
ncbi:MAG: tape measure protein [Phascolarctobacterium sp.]|nr:tape measure protein [Phascolarctobacterium sp.]